MHTLEMEITPPKESAPVKALNEKLRPLKQRRAALEAKWSECCSLVNPYNNAPATERARVEAELAIPRMREDFKRINLDIEDLERERDQALKAEQAQVEAEIDRRIGERVAKMRQLLEPVIPVNREIHGLQELRQKLTGKTTADWFSWWELFPEVGGNETRWGRWCREIRERFGV